MQLLSNGQYHVVAFDGGGGCSRWRNLAVTRWTEDACRTADSGVQLFVSGGDAIGVDCRIAVADDADLELRRFRLTNRGAAACSVQATTYLEPVLASPASDAAHPAFSKMFVETEIDAANAAIIATRRPAKPKDERRWCWHRVVVSGVDGPVETGFETSREHFIGRCRTLASAQALRPGATLGAHAGPVLDAVMAVQSRFTLAAGAHCTLDVFVGVATSRAQCLALVQRAAIAATADGVLERGTRFRAALLQRIGASEDDAALCERLAAAVLVADPRLRAAPATVAANRLGQPGLWAFGISGDVPVVLADVGDAAALPRAALAVKAHAFWAAHGIQVEAMLLAGSPALRAQLEALVPADVLGKRNGIVVRERAALGEAELTLLQAVARIVFDGRDLDVAAPAVVRPPAPDDPAAPPAADAAGIVAFNGHGGFGDGLREYVIHTSAARPTPAPWSNVIANPGFGTIVSDAGSSCTWSENAHELRLTTWSNDPVCDTTAEAIWIRDSDSGDAWSPTLLPARGPGVYTVRHRFGSSVFEHVHDGIASVLEVFVAADAPSKFSALTLHNRSGRARRLSLTACVDWVLGDERAKTLLQIVTDHDAVTQALFAVNHYNSDFPGRTAFFDVDDGADSVSGDRGDVVGDGSPARPAALAAPQLSGRTGAALDPCGALRVAVDLAPGEERQVVFRLGAGKSVDDARALVRRWREPGATAAALAAVRAQWNATLGAVQVQTPDAAVDALANGWLVYQVLAARHWGRTGYYQSSGAYGFRDQLQDVMALVHARPEIVREHLLRAASRQFEQGDVQHWWHPPTGKGIRTHCSDDYLWLPFVAAHYVDVTGDAGVLDAEVPFLRDDPLPDGEESRYGLPQVAPGSAPLHEHCVRAIRNGLRMGVHGLPLMGHGDWNDGMDRVGVDGKGESVWLAFFLIAVLKRYAPVARARGDSAFAEQCSAEAERLTAAADASAWDGRWYLRAWFDDGTPLGSAANAECSIDSIAQSWSVIAGAAPPDRARSAMDAVHERLVRPDIGIVQLLDPPFNEMQPSPGYILGYVPGVRENGGQYTHGAVWTVIAFALLGDADRAWEAFKLLNPVEHGNSPETIARYRTEPYVMAGDVYSSTAHPGRGGWSWYTGSAGWMVQCLLHTLLGVQRRGNVLRIAPLLPHDWPGFTLRLRHGGSRYTIAVRRVDGAAAEAAPIELVDDGAEHALTVEVGSSRK